MEFRILGPLEVAADGRPLALGGPRQRALLAALLVHANEVVSSERLIELVWGDEPPATATTALHGYVSGLRRLLEPERAADASPEVLLTRAPGYLLRVAGDDLDLYGFERLAREGRDALGRGEAERALAVMEDALALWRGPALDDLPPGPFAESERRRLAELRLAALEDRIDAELALGRHGRVAGELEALVARHPLRERLRAQLMLALYRSGRQAEALATYQEARRALVDELGIEPSPELQRLERSILNQDPALDAPTRPEPPPVEAPPPPVEARVPRRRAVIGSALVGVLAAAVAIPVFALGRGSGGGPSFIARGNTLLEIDPQTNRVVGSVPVGARPDAVAGAAGALWVANLDDATVARVDGQAGAVARTISTGRAATGLASDGDGVWFVAAGQGAGTRAGLIDPRFDAVTRTIEAPDLALTRTPAGIAQGAGSLWIVPGGVGMLARIDPSTKRAVRIDTRTCCPTAVAFGAGSAWVADGYVDTVTRVGTENLAVATIPVGHGPSAIAADANGVWVAIEHEDAVARIDPATNAVTERVPVGRSPSGIALGAGSVWVANSRDGTVSRIDVRSRRSTATITVGQSPRSVVFAGGKVWVTVQAAPTAAAGVRAGGVAHLTAQDDVGTLDPALAYTPLSQASFARARLSWQLEYATCAKLLNYPDRPAPVGSQLVPEVARSLPTRSGDGRTYTFTIRHGFRFSPPSDQSVTAGTFKYTIERSLSPRMHGPALGPRSGPAGSTSAVLGDVVGAAAYMAGRAAHISGIVARGDRLTITLLRPDPTLPARVALPFFCAVPTDTPIDPRGLRTVPSAGPYYVATYDPGQRIVLRRNRHYGGDRQAHLEEIDVAIGVPQAEAVAQIEAGRADYALDGVPAEQDARLTRLYGAGSPAARSGHRRYFVNPTLTLYGLVLNTSRPPFSDPALRRAVNYAIDRRALLRLTASFIPATATDQYLPPGMPGFRDVRIYPETPDLRRARALAHGRRTAAVFYSCTFCVQVTNLVVRELAAIGIDVRVKEFAVAGLQRRISTRGEPFDLTITARSADYGDPSALLAPLFDGRAIRADGNDDVSYLADPDVERRLDAAARLSGAARYLAYAALDDHLARDVAPLVPVANATRQDFFSRRMGCQVYQPIYGTDLAALCIEK